jgi:oxygen-independent coproporphyrinogen-3 oxidase
VLDDASPARADAVGSVYVHAPFCARRCVYCDFAVEVRRQGDLTGWLAAVAGELALVAAESSFPLAERLHTLYVGGGTPSLLGPDAMAGLAAVLGFHRVSDPEMEWTVEANPESFTAGIAAAWRKAGVNRLSLGAQSFHGPALQWMGRLHGPEGVGTAVGVARQAGFDNISIDLMFGLPGDLGRSWTLDLERALELEPRHVSLYGLTVEAATPLGRAVRQGREKPVDDERYREEYLQAAAALTSAGYRHYEVSNFARPGGASRHNFVYWSGDSYLGLGNGAHSYADPLRRWNHRDWESYSGAVHRGESPEAGRETIDDDARRLESVWLGLRTDRGISVADLPSRASAMVERWMGAHLATMNGDRLRLTADGWLVLDGLTVELDECLAG